MVVVCHLRPPAPALRLLVHNEDYKLERAKTRRSQSDVAFFRQVLDMFEQQRRPLISPDNILHQQLMPPVLFDSLFFLIKTKLRVPKFPDSIRLSFFILESFLKILFLIRSVEDNLHAAGKNSGGTWELFKHREIVRLHEIFWYCINVQSGDEVLVKLVVGIIVEVHIDHR
ncbi:hypothetical protein L6452_32341 [Arctium lappa]|uniref:Uncharacterized protein n=1 Tax=Arctium lappa TaxID=4217 RepID=A0ACB8Z4D3_ARCLA|nr:hypothetical protein L6452_32341 [Arctium lappa]